MTKAPMRKRSRGSIWPGFWRSRGHGTLDLCMAAGFHGGFESFWGACFRGIPVCAGLCRLMPHRVLWPGAALLAGEGVYEIDFTFSHSAGTGLFFCQIAEEEAAHVTNQILTTKVPWLTKSVGEYSGRARLPENLPMDCARCWTRNWWRWGRGRAAADEFAGEFNVLCRYGSYEALVNDPKIDAVYVATPHSLHAENALMALEAGKPVLCEKPFAINAR